VRSDDLVVRMGGDEFLALFDAADERLVAERARRTVASILIATWDDVVPGLVVSVSAGFAVGPAGRWTGSSRPPTGGCAGPRNSAEGAWWPPTEGDPMAVSRPAPARRSIAHPGT